MKKGKRSNGNIFLKLQVTMKCRMCKKRKKYNFLKALGKMNSYVFLELFINCFSSTNTEGNLIDLASN